MEWLTIEVYDGAFTARSWNEAYHDVLVRTAVGFGCVYWDVHEHRWGVVTEFCFLDEMLRDGFREAAIVKAALDAVPNPVGGLLVYPHRGGGSGTRMPRRPRPTAGAGAAEVPVPAPEATLETRPSDLHLLPLSA